MLPARVTRAMATTSRLKQSALTAVRQAAAGLSVVVGVEGEHRRNEQHREQEQGGDRVEGEDERAETEPTPAGGQGFGLTPDRLQTDEPGQAAGGDTDEVDELGQSEPAVDDQRQDTANQDQGQGKDRRCHRRSLASLRLGKPWSGPDHGGHQTGAGNGRHPFTNKGKTLSGEGNGNSGWSDERGAERAGVAERSGSGFRGDLASRHSGHDHFW